MKSYEYDDFDPEDEIALRDAPFQYGNAEITEQARMLQQQGINLEALVIYGDSRDEPYDQLAKLMSQLKREITEQLRDGALIAFGYTQDIIPGPRFIPCYLWRHGQISIKRSLIELKRRSETRMTDIVVFKRPIQPSNDVDRTPKAANRADIRQAYQTYIQDLVRAGKRSNRDQDVAAMKEIFGDGVTNLYIRELRVEYAPKSWSKVGRNKQS